MMTFEWRGGWIPQSTTKLSWSVKMRTIQEEVFANRCVGWDINCCKPYEEMTTSDLVHSFVLISPFCQDINLPLKSPKII